MKKYSVVEDFKKYETTSIAIVPVKNMKIDKKYKIDNVVIYPPNSVDSAELTTYKFDFNFSDYKDEFFGATLICFPTEDAFDFYRNPMPSEKQDILNKNISFAEEKLDIIRYVFANLEACSNLPYRAGFLRDNYSAVLLYSPSMRTFVFIKEKFVVNSNALGKGLDIKISNYRKYLDEYFIIFRKKCGEIGEVLKYAFKLYSNIVYAENSTTKFMLSISMLEYLANPYEYMKMQEVKKKIIPFVANDKTELHQLSERFKELTSMKDSQGNQIGYRTCIIHNGLRIEDILKSNIEVKMLLREMQTYIAKVIGSLIKHYNKDWDEVEALVSSKREACERKKSHVDCKIEADTVVIIDAKFLNKAIEEVFLFYPQYRERTINISKLLFLLLQQADIKLEGYKVPFLIYYDSHNLSINNCIDSQINLLDGKGTDTLLGEIDIYTEKVGSNYYDRIEMDLKTYLSEDNFALIQSSKFSKLVFISDRGTIDNEILKESKDTLKNIILGRLDNNRTTMFDELNWFDIQYFIMDCFEIDKTEAINQEFIFKIEDGLYAQLR
jgi:hypothetical protein